MVKVLHVKKILSDKKMSNMEGEYFDQNKFHTILTEDADVYTEDGKLLLKFRKNVIPKILTDLALESYRTQAKVKHNNRGASAGVLDPKKLQNYVSKLYHADQLYSPSKFRTRYFKPDGTPSKSSVSNLAPSNIAGYFDVKNTRSGGDKSTTSTKVKTLSSVTSPSVAATSKGGSKGGEVHPPCRLTSFTRDHKELWSQSIPFLQMCDLLFRELIPENHHLQWIKAQLTPDYAISDTAFSTVTLNYSWRTALHQDAGDCMEGFGNLIVIEDTKNPNHYQGCYTGFPQYGVACDARTGDFLAMDVHQWHCNTEFISDMTDNVEVYSRRKSIKDTSSNLMANDWHYNRLSIVCYLRDKMINCKTSTTTDRDIKKLNQKYNELFNVHV